MSGLQSPDQPSVPALVDVLKAHGISPTVQRVCIARILLSKKQHLSADQVISKLTEQGATVSKATVYNTLGLFADRSLVRQLIVDPTKVFYDSNILPHHHYYNVDDGTLVDVEPLQLSLEDLPKCPPGTKLDGIDIVIRVRNRDDENSG